MLIFYMQRLDFRKLYDCRRLLFIFKLRHLQHDIINTLLPFYMIADDILCTSYMIFVIKCPLPPSNVMFVLFSLSVLESVWLIPCDFLFFSTVGVLITVVAIACPVWRVNFIYRPNY